MCKFGQTLRREGCGAGVGRGGGCLVGPKPRSCSITVTDDQQLSSGGPRRSSRTQCWPSGPGGAGSAPCSGMPRAARCRDGAGRGGSRHACIWVPAGVQQEARLPGGAGWTMAGAAKPLPLAAPARGPGHPPGLQASCAGIPGKRPPAGPGHAPAGKLRRPSRWERPSRPTAPAHLHQLMRYMSSPDDSWAGLLWPVRS